LGAIRFVGCNEAFRSYSLAALMRAIIAESFLLLGGLEDAQAVAKTRGE